MTAQRQFIFWFFVAAAFLALLFLFSPVLLPFVLGITIAYLLDPAVLKLTRYGFGRGVAAFVILFLFFAVIAGLLFILAPLAWHQFTALADNLPVYVEKFHAFLDLQKGRIESFLAPEKYTQTAKFVGDNGGAMAGVADSVFGGIAQGWGVVSRLLTLVCITPVVSYFMMKEWPRITGGVFDLFPRRHKDVIFGLLKKIDIKISGFIRGQLIVAFILGLSYALALTLAGLEYGFLIGILTGIFSVIPLVGSTLGLMAGVVVAWLQAGDWVFVMIVAGIFIGGQLIEGNLLTPKFVGDRVGLHPLWIFFALMAGGSLLGITGMLIAVPVAAAASVVIAFIIDQYKLSPYYKGIGHG